MSIVLIEKIKFITIDLLIPKSLYGASQSLIELLWFGTLQN